MFAVCLLYETSGTNERSQYEEPPAWTLMAAMNDCIHTLLLLSGRFPCTPHVKDYCLSLSPGLIHGATPQKVSTKATGNGCRDIATMCRVSVLGWFMTPTVCLGNMIISPVPHWPRQIRLTRFQLIGLRQKWKAMRLGLSAGESDLPFSWKERGFGAVIAPLWLQWSPTSWCLSWEAQTGLPLITINLLISLRAV